MMAVKSGPKRQRPSRSGHTESLFWGHAHLSLFLLHWNCNGARQNNAIRRRRCRRHCRRRRRRCQINQMYFATDSTAAGLTSLRLYSQFSLL